MAQASEAPPLRFSVGVDVGSILPSGAVGDVLTFDGIAWGPAAPGGGGGGGVVWPLTAPDGSAAAPSYSFVASTGTGMYSSGVDQLNFSTAGVDRLMFDNIGNIGIGTATPLSVGGLFTSPFIHKAANFENLTGSSYLIATGNSDLGFGPGAVPGGGIMLTDISAPLNQKSMAMFTMDGVTMFYNFDDTGVPYANPLAIDIRSNDQFSVQIGNSNNASVALGVYSSVAGLKLPDMTEVERDAIVGTPSLRPATGLMIFNSDTRDINVYDGISWVPVGGSVFADNVFRIQDDVDATKQLAFECVNITGGNTRTMIVPDNSGILPTTPSLNSLATGATNYTFTGFDNTLYGIGCGVALTTGYDNTCIGNQALAVGDTCRENVAIGYRSMFKNESGYDNVAVGFLTLFNNIAGESNVAVGYYSLGSTTSSNNTGVGTSTLTSNTIGIENVAVGSLSTANSVNASNNTAVGFRTLYSTASSDNTAVGHRVLTANIGGTRNCGFGASALAGRFAQAGCEWPALRRLGTGRCGRDHAVGQ